MEHSFTSVIHDKLKKAFGDEGDQVFKASLLLQYINIKTRSAQRGSKARGSFANLYAIYVLVEDYLRKKFEKSGKYKNYEGARFAALFQRQRELPFGQKLQNHALNHRLNEEFHKYFPTAQVQPIIRNVESNRYWFNERLLWVEVGKKRFNVAKVVSAVIDEYILAKQDAFRRFIESFERLREIDQKGSGEAAELILSMLEPNIDARIFEVVSFSILKFYYYDQIVYFGFDRDNLEEENLSLYKTGRTNANDGGIDFVMRPLGRFFQVTETTDVKKYFLDIDKIQKYPITFVIKSSDPVLQLARNLREKAREQYPVTSVVRKYMKCIEEIINVPILAERLKEAIQKDHLRNIVDEIVRQSKVEFNYPEVEE